MEKYIEKIIDGAINFGGKLLLGCIIILVGFKLVNFAMKRLHKGVGFNKLEKTSQKAENLTHEAIEKLSIFPDSEYKSYLSSLAEYMLMRDH